MDAQESARLIAMVGGVKALAKLLGLDETDWHMQRVTNWRTRGIPAAVILDHYELFQELRAQLPRRRKAN